MRRHVPNPPSPWNRPPASGRVGYSRIVVVVDDCDGGLRLRIDLTDRQQPQFPVDVGVAIDVSLGLALNNILLGVAFGVLIGAGPTAASK